MGRGISWSVRAVPVRSRTSSNLSRITGFFSITTSAFTASARRSYTWQDWKGAFDILYGSGLHRGFANTKRSCLEYFNRQSVSAAKFEDPEDRLFKIRFDVVNLLDKIYELRDGSGIGVGAPQFGQRRGFYGTVAYDF